MNVLPEYIYTDKSEEPDEKEEKDKTSPPEKLQMEWENSNWYLEWERLAKNGK